MPDTKQGRVAGTLLLFMGPMWSGKSDRLITHLDELEASGKFTAGSIQAFRPAADTREPSDWLVSRTGKRRPCTRVSDCQDLLAKLLPTTQVVAIDEINLMPLREKDNWNEVRALVTGLARRSIHIVIAGLDTDYMGRPFPPVPALSVLADAVIRLTAKCERCGAEATHSYRKTHSDALHLPGGDALYEPRCRECFKA